MSTLPEPPLGLNGWPRRLTTALQQLIIQFRSDIQALQLKTTAAGRVQFCAATLPMIGEVICNGAVYNRADLPHLFRAISTTFNTGGETSLQFRVPNIAAPAGMQYRISTQ